MADSISLIVEGMTCNHCVKRVKEVLLEVNGIESVDVSLEEKKVTIKAQSNAKEGLSLSLLSEILEEEGYSVISQE